ncbi:hypothetical protein GGI43DRAFT_245426 [Trichoderma evansii]
MIKISGFRISGNRAPPSILSTKDERKGLMSVLQLLSNGLLTSFLELLTLLIQEGIDPEAVEPEYGTPLCHTAFDICPEICSQMVKIPLQQPRGRLKAPSFSRKYGTRT